MASKRKLSGAESRKSKWQRELLRSAEATESITTYFARTACSAVSTSEGCRTLVTTGTSAESKSLTAPDTCTSQPEVLSDLVSVDRADRLEIIQGANIAVGITTSSNEGEALCSSSLEHPTLSSPQGDSVPSTSNHLTVKALEIINGTCQGIEAYPDDIKVGWETEARRDATAHLNALCNFGILIGVVALYRLLHPLAMITKCLQGKAVDIVKAFRDIQEVKHDFQCLRDGVDMEFQAIYNQAERLGQSVGVEPSLPRIAKMQMYRDNYPAENPLEYYRRTLAIPFLDCIISELDFRFTELSRTASNLLHLVPSIIVSSDYNIQETIKLYETDLHDSCVVDQELKLWKRKWIDCLEKDRPDSLGAAILECDEERFPNVFRLIKIGCTIPITSCTCERSFSTLRRLRNWMRSSMSCSRLSSLALMNIHYNHEVNLDRAVEIFLTLHPRKIDLSNLMFS
ncbi:hypothetical protein EMCRGX_G014061 [Ephydatia muelleri]